ncbi:hypothetical protein ADK67_19065 [Saccharothrix sp. NRRL B-16348]|uniref:ThiF family adenylyltransferase n=1 Tax=Saccharothrix sp. NRRL B-16348 TaxID=1415542 RepID=UPI0006C058E2|nr:ThiF family adenylyltransferase [Saccharothrix sp. NRRL B-16348]KOX24396.1 hypothetical protein ADK67_19065 [Saccharothrix sp. NRRL B-16348]
MSTSVILLTREGAAAIRAGTGWGFVTTRTSDADGVGVVIAVSDGRGFPRPVGIVDRLHYLNVGDAKQNCTWHRVAADVNHWWLHCSAKRGVIAFDEFAGMIPGFRQPGGVTYLAITHAPDLDERHRQWATPEFAAWRVTPAGVLPLDLEVQREKAGTALLESHWPVGIVGAARFLVVGLGSIGGAAALALATAGAGTLDLVDPDRLRWHNLPRHVCGARHVGRMKAEAIRADLELLRPDTKVNAYGHDVVEDADHIRDLLPDVDVIVCAADGVAPRRVVSHLARRAGKPAILSCVLADGAYGDVVRLWPWPHHGCLTCRTEALADAGGLLPDLHADAGYGSAGHPMTAVGSDLHLVGQFAAKFAVATHLQGKGQHDQRFAGEHAVLALRPEPGWAAPYDLIRAGEVRWHSATPPRAGCSTCGPA